MVSAYEIPYSPGRPDDWATDPRRVWDALEELGDRKVESHIDLVALATEEAFS